MSVEAAPLGASIESSAPAQRSRASRILRQVRRRPIESVGGVILWSTEAREVVIGCDQIGRAHV